MIFRLWSATNNEGLPYRNATCDWWQLCDCGHLDRIDSDTRGPRGLLVDSDDGVPDDVADLAAKLSHICRAPQQQRREYAPPPPRAPAIVWTADMDDIVRHTSLARAAAELGISNAAVSRRRAKLDVAPGYTQWTAYMDDVVITRDITAAMAELELSRNAIEWRRRQLRKMGKLAREKPEARAWTPEEDALIMSMSIAAGAKATGRSAGAVRTRRSVLRRTAAA